MLVPTRRRTRRGMTIVEIALVLAMIALVAGIALPKLDSGTGLAVDQQAQATASGALDTALAQTQYAGGPVAVSTAALAAANGDIAFVDADTASASTGTASVGASGSKIAVAVVGDPATDACWYSWRDLAAPTGSPSAGFFVRAGGSSLPCTATAALGLTRDASGTAGGSWAKPQQVA